MNVLCAGSASKRATTTKKAYFDMDNWLIFCAGMAGFLAISLPFVALTDWLQKKMDEWNEYNDEQQQLNETEQ